jgi:hypothetical protein
MKTLIAIVVCLAVGFGGMQLYQWSKKSQKPETSAEEEKPEQAKAAEKPPAREEKPSRPAVRRPSTGTTRPKKSPEQKPVAVKSNDPPASKPKPKQSAKRYFVPEEMNPNGIPSVIAIHNMPSEGKVFRLHLVGVRDLNKDKFGRKVKSGNAKEWEWDVSVEGGVIRLAHKGQNIPQGR